MASTLFTSWSDYDTAVLSVLGCAEHSLLIFDPDLQRLPLEQPAVCERLTGFLRRHPGNRLQVVVQDSDHLLRHSPRLMGLLATYGHVFSVTVAAESLASLADTMLLADSRHAAIRFHRDQPRGRLLLDEPEAVRPYDKRFADILAEGGSPVLPGVAGL